MILRFKHKGLKRLHQDGDRSKVLSAMVEEIEEILLQLDVASDPQGMSLPGLGLHPLKGKLAGSWAVWVTGNWRIVFRFDGTNATDVDLIDYH